MSEQKVAFSLFVLGALLFAAALASPSNDLDVDYRTELCMVLFGLPYVLRALTRRINWLAVLYLVLLVPACYFAAWIAAAFAWGLMNGGSLATPPGAMFAVGAAGGLTGSALSFLALLLPGLRVDGAPRALRTAGIALLTVLGGFGLAMADPGEAWSLVLWLFLPWQIVFAYFLSRLLKPSPPKGAAAA